MDSFLNHLGFDPGILIIALGIMCMALLVYNVILTVVFSNMKKSYLSFMKGRDGASLEEILKVIVEDNQKVKEHETVNTKAIEEIRTKLEFCSQKQAIVKYNAFSGMAGKLSFVICQLDEKNNGYLMNCMHSPEGCYTYMKNVTAGAVDVALSEEEKQALLEAEQVNHHSRM